MERQYSVDKPIRMSQIVNNILHSYRLLHVIKTRNYLPAKTFSQAITPNKVQETPLYMKRDEDYKITKKRVMKKLEELLNIRPYIAKEIVSKYKNFLKVSGIDISENYYSCLTNAITKITLIKFPEVLAASDISSKINELKKLPYDINESTPLLSLTYNKIKVFVAQEIEVRRIARISKALKVKECEVCKFIVERPFLISLDIVLLENNIKLLKGFLLHLWRSSEQNVDKTASIDHSLLSEDMPSTSREPNNISLNDNNSEMESSPGTCFQNLLLQKVTQTAVIKSVKRRIDVAEIITKESYLATLKKKEEEKLAKLKEKKEEKVAKKKNHGITNEDIIKDLWVLRYSTSIIKERMTLAKDDNIETFKTWMVRAQPEIFETYVKRRSDTKLILGDNSLAEYLSERLECTEEVAKYLISKLPALQSKSLKKMNEMIDFLFAHGFKPIHICRVPKILLHSVDTTRNRLRELEAQGMHLDTLYILTKSQKQYMQYYESLTKSNKNKLKNC
ncbi:hypothetical protein NQ314_007725 [Rhamnusium bicolor]|uniref:Uncharacterized protein n=1 Tax=Rhamnusium bicolor TaxID=1586634 RepID=A0AAV8YKI7_9CUCU|nr:hypothetical protein NQ314_007725 [Rhamnusium bicolor]